MPTKEQHIVQAQHNRDFWSNYDLDSTTFRDWVVNGIFYEAVHWTEAVLSKRNEHSDNHSERLNSVRRYPETQPIAVDLEQLKQDSENARYRCYGYTADEIRKDLITALDRINRRIHNIL